MWSRIDLKMRAKQAFQRNYWSAVAVALVMSILTVASAGTSVSNSYRSVWGGSEYYYSSRFALFALIIMGIAAVAGVVILLLKIFVGNVLRVGGVRFFVLNQNQQAQAGSLMDGFKSGHYTNIVLIIFLQQLFISLWTLLFIVPGIVKAYEYMMIPYILAENPGMQREDAFAISKKMMDGQKWNAFVLDLSFLGWHLLSAITFGIVGLFYVQPYYEATIAELYSANRVIAYQNGYIR